jgi:hypothetical protein
MFQFSGFASITGYLPYSKWVAPFGNLRVKQVFAPNRSLSQLVTSFFASESLGIRHTLLLTYLSLALKLCSLYYIYSMSKNFLPNNLAIIK